MITPARVAGVVLLIATVVLGHWMRTGALAAPLVLCYTLALVGAFLVGRGIRSHWLAGAIMFSALVLTSLGIRYI